MANAVGHGYSSIRHMGEMAEILQSELFSTLTSTLYSDPVPVDVDGMEAWPWQPRNLRERDVHKRASQMGLSLKAKITHVDLPLKTSADDDTVIYERWPLLLPHDVVPWPPTTFTSGPPKLKINCQM